MLGEDAANLQPVAGAKDESQLPAARRLRSGGKMYVTTVPQVKRGFFPRHLTRKPADILISQGFPGISSYTACP
jgi:hypothetical protein